jgi:hypothetical protein
MMARRGLIALMCGLPALAVFAYSSSRAPLPDLPPRDGQLNVFHLGHSLVGPDMPFMLQQLAGDGHRYNSQLGSGTTLRQHWEPEEAILDYEKANHAPAFRDARQGIGSGDYDAVVLTAMVELKDAIRWHKSPKYFRRWAGLARDANPETRVYLYETWHWLDDPDGWMERVDADLDPLWLDKLAGPDTWRNPDRPAWLIPGGQALAAVARAAEAGGLEGISRREELFGRDPEGKQDPIHFGQLGAYVIALTHYAVLYQKPPMGLPHELMLRDGTPAQAFSKTDAAKVQDIVWQVVTSLPRTGVSP